jgi:Flp pilus assembly protein TadG
MRTIFSTDPQSAVARLARRFARSNAGNVAIIFGFMLIPLLTAVGGAVDLSRALLAEQRLHNALDATALAVGANETMTEAELQQLAQDFFNANYPDELLGTPGPISVEIVDGVVNISGTTQLNTTLLALIDIDEMNIAASTQVVRESKSLEVMLVLDNTGSMAANGKITALKDATEILVNILFGEETVHPKLKIGFVPFSQAVNVGTDKAGAFWIDSNAQSSIHGENFNADGGGNPINIFDLYDDLTDKNWNGCVETRPEPLDELDTVPTAVGNTDTLWVPYFYPDEPGGRGWTYSNYANSYLADGISGTYEERQKHWGKYAGGDAYGTGPHWGCAVAPVTALTNVKSELISAIADFVASGYTHIPIGLAWGWRLVSPDEPFTEGAPYDDPETNKAIVLLTDGYNTLQRQWTHNTSYYSAYGYVNEGRLGTTDYNTAVAQLDPKTATVCQNIKDQGIRLYTITFQLPNGSIKDLMRACATETSLYYDSPSNSELQTVFETIAKDLSNLRISQ